MSFLAIFVTVRGFPSEYCRNVWYQKLEWCSYWWSKNFF